MTRLARGAGVAAAAGVAGRLTLRAEADKVWQLDPSVCAACDASRPVVRPAAGMNNGPDGLSKCATECVLKKSAVKAVNDFSICGYCNICPGYHDVRSPADADGMPTGLVCPYDAIIRRPVGPYDESDPENNQYEYTIDEDKCTGCGKCVIGCRPPFGNGSLRLEVRHNLCVDCNQCAIAAACPSEAFKRESVRTKRPR